jgi:serine/threonine protein kinase
VGEGRSWSIEDFAIGKPVGKGRYGSVYMCQHKQSGRLLALKILFKEQLVKDNVVHQVSCLLGAFAKHMHH